ncbi:MAG TPA: protein kinase, partial [Kofleriaceae bacterium]
MGDADDIGAEPERTEELVAPQRNTAVSTRAEGPRALVGPSIKRGTAIGRYIVLDVLGSGGMGLVYLAIDPELDRKVAIKLMRNRTPEGHARLAREAQAMARVQHPNVVAVHDVGSFGDLMFVAMDYIDGTTLAGWLAASARTWREIVRVFLDAGQGLVAAHTAGVV